MLCKPRFLWRFAATIKVVEISAADKCTEAEGDGFVDSFCEASQQCGRSGEGRERGEGRRCLLGPLGGTMIAICYMMYVIYVD